jgi:oligo-1,6-glucosidase
VLHLLRGTPYVYQGEELGMTNYPFSSIEDFEDIEAVNYHDESVGMGEDPAQVLVSLRAMGRDNARTPMQWDDSPHAGFSTVTPWLPANPNHTEINAAAQEKDPDSVLEHYRALIRFRHDEPTVAYGDFTLELPQDDQLFAYSRHWEGTELLVVANFGGETADVPDAFADRCRDAELVLSNGEVDEGVRMLPWEARVYRRRRQQ